MSRLVTQQVIKVQLTPVAQKQLKAHAIQILKKQQDTIKQKLEKDLQKTTKIKEIQTNFVKWVEKKSLDSQLKLQKVQKNKEQKIAGIVKKCKQRQKYLTKKKQEFKVKKKKNLNLAWKQAEKFNQDIQNYYKSKNFMNRSGKISYSNSLTRQHQTNLEQQNNQRIERQIQKEPMQNLNNKSINALGVNKTYSSLNNNHSNNNILTKNMSYTFYGNDQRFNRVQSLSTEYHIKQKNNYILEKHKQIDQQKHNLMIQQLGRKLQRIQQSRNRRRNRIKKQSKQQGNDQSRGKNYTDIDFSNKKSPKNNNNQNKKTHQDRVHSEHTYKKQSRIKNRALDARIRRQQMFEQQIVQGYSYLQSTKIRHLKTVISKNIAYNAIEKKLYIQRMNN